MSLCEQEQTVRQIVVDAVSQCAIHASLLQRVRAHGSPAGWGRLWGWGEERDQDASEQGGKREDNH